MQLRKKKKIKNILFELFMIALILLLFYPVLMIFFMSLKDDMEILLSPLSLPKSFQFDNYVKAFEQMDFIRVFCNSPVHYHHFRSGWNHCLLYFGVCAGQGKKASVGIYGNVCDFPAWPGTSGTEYADSAPLPVQRNGTDEYISWNCAAVFERRGAFQYLPAHRIYQYSAHHPWRRLRLWTAAPPMVFSSRSYCRC